MLGRGLQATVSGGPAVRLPLRAGLLGGQPTSEAEPQGKRRACGTGWLGPRSDRPHAAAGGGRTLQGSTCEQGYSETLPDAHGGAAMTGNLGLRAPEMGPEP